ncbi:hypothetical protein [Clostridium tyrobutyricum]|jgi:hypothetical protein|uniref:hypothetical protein n=1 Tax=Clostridium tyrobutyricum TaxID=1519 RepID=UPI000E8E1A8E|nr:hypothetical protein [Clostridium tyrobutyricum]HBF77800.1 hypothetical protein [Clostridiaceae bacterium]
MKHKIKTKKGGLSIIITTIFLVIVSVYLLGSYRINVATPTKGLIKSGNKQIMEMDKAMNKK